MSFTHYESKNIFLERRYLKEVNYRSRILDDLNIDFEAELFQNNSCDVPKIRGRAAMHNLDLYLSEFTFKKIQKIGECFAVEHEESVIKEK